MQVGWQAGWHPHSSSGRRSQPVQDSQTCSQDETALVDIRTHPLLAACLALNCSKSRRVSSSTRGTPGLRLRASSLLGSLIGGQQQVQGRLRGWLRR
jgi:hypothetical protein